MILNTISTMKVLCLSPIVSEMADKIRRNLSPMNDAPEAFWKERLAFNEKRLERAQERLDAANQPATRIFWEARVKNVQRRIQYCRERSENAVYPR